MDIWEDKGIVVSNRIHGEGGAVVGVFTIERGYHCGYVKGGNSQKNKNHIEIGNLVDVQWKARISDNLGSYKIESIKNYSALIMQDRLKLSALISACAICERAFPERITHASVFYGLRALLDTLASNDDHDIWGASIVLWEVSVLKELGFALELNRCAAGGSNDNLKYVSPRTGRAVSAEAGEIYKSRLFTLPRFLSPSGIAEGVSFDCVINGLRITEHFMQEWVFAHHSRGIPQARTIFGRKMEEFAGQEKEMTIYEKAI